MIIKNYKQIFNNVAEELNVDKSLVEKVVEFTWNDLNNSISNFKKREVYVYKLGTFRFRKARAERYIRSNPHLFDFLSKTAEERKQFLSVKTWYSKANAMQTLLEESIEILKERNEFKRKRDESINGSIQEPVEDMGGT